jgi:phospholipase C
MPDATPDNSHALDRIVVVLFENRSLDNVLGHLYAPGDGKTFEGVIGKELSNPIPEWAEHGAERKMVPDTVATDMDAPNLDSGEIEKDAAAGTLPDFWLIEPNMAGGHDDYHPALGRALGASIHAEALDPPSSLLGGEALLVRIFNAYRSSTSETGSNVWNTTLLIGWDEPGGTYDHVPPATCLRPTRTHPQASSASRSTAPATASPRSSSPPGFPRAQCSTTSTATPR